MPVGRRPAQPNRRSPLRIERDAKLDFKDVLIRPKRSTLNSRADVDIRRTFRFVHAAREWTGFPLIASNMDTIGTISMARAFAPFGAIVALHKHYPAEKLIAFFNSEEADNVFCTMGTTEADEKKFALVKSKAPIGKISLDVAN